jgi:hypothetical protein
MKSDLDRLQPQVRRIKSSDPRQDDADIHLSYIECPRSPLPNARYDHNSLPFPGEMNAQCPLRWLDEHTGRSTANRDVRHPSSFLDCNERTRQHDRDQTSSVARGDHPRNLPT